MEIKWHIVNIMAGHFISHFTHSHLIRLDIVVRCCWMKLGIWWRKWSPSILPCDGNRWTNIELKIIWQTSLCAEWRVRIMTLFRHSRHPVNLNPPTREGNPIVSECHVTPSDIYLSSCSAVWIFDFNGFLLIRGSIIRQFCDFATGKSHLRYWSNQFALHRGVN